MKIVVHIIFIAAFGLSVFAQENKPSYLTMLAWSPDSKQISFTAIRQITSQTTGKMAVAADIYVINADGTGRKKITGDSSNEFGGSWSKDGKRLFFDLSPQDNPKENKIYSQKTDGTDLIQIIKTTSGRSSAPQISNDGKKIVFNLETVEHKPQIYVMNRDGFEIKALTNDNTLAFYNPVWSPDGKMIVYYVERGDSKDQIWTMNADGSNPQLLTNNIGHNYYPSWSADGKQIIFCSMRDGEPGIYTMNIDGSNLKKLPGVNGSYARMSPDGKKIAFIVGKFPVSNIIVANSDGTNKVNITEQK